MINGAEANSFPELESRSEIVVGPEAVWAWLEAMATEPTTSFEVDIEPSKATEWVQDANAIIGSAQKKWDKIDADPNLYLGRDYFKYMTAERGTDSYTEELAVYIGEGPNSNISVVRRFSDNDPSEPHFTIDADIIEEIGSASGQVDARHSHTVVQKASTDEEHVDQEHTRTALSQEQVAAILTQVLSTLREKVDSL